MAGDEALTIATNAHGRGVIGAPLPPRAGVLYLARQGFAVFQGGIDEGHG